MCVCVCGFVRVYVCGCVCVCVLCVAGGVGWKECGCESAIEFFTFLQFFDIFKLGERDGGHLLQDRD